MAAQNDEKKQGGAPAPKCAAPAAPRLRVWEHGSLRAGGRDLAAGAALPAGALPDADVAALVKLGVLVPSAPQD